jgi:hypothetical protein
VLLPPLAETEVRKVEDWLAEDPVLMVTVLDRFDAYDYIVRSLGELVRLVETERANPPPHVTAVSFDIYRGRDIFPVRGVAGEELTERALAAFESPLSGDIKIVDPRVTYPSLIGYLHDGYTLEHMTEALRALAGREVMIGPNPGDQDDDVWDRAHRRGTIRSAPYNVRRRDGRSSA